MQNWRCRHFLQPIISFFLAGSGFLFFPAPSFCSALRIPRDGAKGTQAMGTLQEAKGEEKEKKDVSGKVDGPIIVVLKVEMHCEGCALKIRRSVKGLKGVKAVASEILESKLTVIGKVDPLELRGHLESKMHKKVDLISPVIAVKTEESSKAKGNQEANAKKPDKDKDQKNADVNRPNEPSVTSVVLKIPLHCEGCTQRIKKQICKIKGVDSVSIDSEKDLVTVNGTMDVTNLPGFLAAKLRRGVEVVNQKKNEDGVKEKKEKKDNGDAGKEKGHEAAKTAATDASKLDYYGSGYGFYPYRIEIVRAPELFSDDNPNACSIM